MIKHKIKSKILALIFATFLLIGVFFVGADGELISDDNGNNNINYGESIDTNIEPGSCTCTIIGTGYIWQGSYCDLAPNGDHCTGINQPSCSTIINPQYPQLIESCGCNCIGPDPACIEGQTQPCPNQNGVCSGSFEVCNQYGQWPGCNTNTYTNWANSHNWVYQANNELTCNDNQDNDCDNFSDCLDSNCNIDPYCLQGICLNINYYYNDECDDADERNSWGKICKVEDCSSTIEYWYDDRGNVIEQNFTIDGYSFIIEYEYDSSNNLIKEELPNDKDIEYFYNELNQVERVEYDNKDVSIYYTQEGFLDNLIYENDVDVDYSYNNRNIVDEINIDSGAENLFNKEYEYDNVGNLRFLNEDGNLLAEFVYDNLYRLISVDDDNYYDFNILNFQYDKSGNRLNKNQDGNNAVYSYESSSNRLLSVNSGSGYNLEIYDNAVDSLLSFDYDSSGNLVKVNNVKKYYYNIDNMLVSVDINNNGYADEQYSYNYKNQRVKKAYGLSQGPYFYENSGTIYYVYDYKGDLVYSLKKTLGNTPVTAPTTGAILMPDTDDGI
ncbi:MAG: hypothetical protein V1663_02880 [archaeon]